MNTLETVSYTHLDVYKRQGGLWAIGSVWGISYMIVTFMTYSAVATTEENIFTAVSYTHLSRIMTGGSATAARAMEMSWRWPCERPLPVSYTHLLAAESCRAIIREG